MGFLDVSVDIFKPSPRFDIRVIFQGWGSFHEYSGSATHIFRIEATDKCSISLEYNGIEHLWFLKDFSRVILNER